MKHLCSCESPPQFKVKDKETKIIQNKTYLHSKPAPYPVNHLPPSPPVSSQPQYVPPQPQYVSQPQAVPKTVIQKEPYLANKGEPTSSLTGPIGAKQVKFVQNVSQLQP